MSPLLRNVRSRIATELLAPCRLLSTTPSIVTAPISRSNAFINRATEQQLNDAASAAAKLPSDSPSPVRGRLVGIKDNICTADLPTTCGSGILQNFVSPFDATVVKKIREHGGIIAGKTNLDEFGMGSNSMNSVFGPVINPSATVANGDKYFSAGGSSGGSAAAVSEGSCWAAVGTDTGGSVRLPAAFCGVVGFKPSYGMLSRYGIVAYANSLDTVGILGSKVKDVQSLYHVMNGVDDQDPTCLGKKTRRWIDLCVKEAEISRASRNLRVGVPVEYKVWKDAMIRNAWVDTLDVMRRNMDLEIELVPVSLPSTKLALAAYYIIAPAEASSNLAKYDGVRYGHPSPAGRSKADALYAQSRLDGLGNEVRRRILLGSYSLSSTAIDNYFLKAQKVRRLVQDDFNRVFAMHHPLQRGPNGVSRDGDGVDFLLVPTAPDAAPSFMDLANSTATSTYEQDVLTVPASMAGLPALSLPVKNDEMGRSIGMQLIGQYGDDEFVIDMAQFIESKRERVKMFRRT